MYIESVTLRNFRCFGIEPTRIDLESDVTVLIGNNGTGKTATCQALQRVFGITSEERTVRVDDFHVAADETADRKIDSRELSIDVVLAFPELDVEGADVAAVPDFFRRMAAADDDGHLKCRLVLKSTWTEDGTVDGTVETNLVAVTSFAEEYAPEHALALPAAERSRIQFVYVPASRDGARQVMTFLRGRLWRAAQWSGELRKLMRQTAEKVGESFHEEKAVQAVEAAFAKRWGQLHGAGTHATPRFQPLEPDIDQLLRGAELTFAPDHAAIARPARLLSDGQRSLLHLALTTASLDIEGSLAKDASDSGFDTDAAHLPVLTVLAVEEPENNLSAFYLSRITGQLLELGGTPRVQVLLSSHSASSLTRVEPEAVRYLRFDDAGAVAVHPITLPENKTEAGTYIREAVRAHPELYFARFVVLGEGDSEQIVLPAIARALGIDLDPAFVAMVPLGGRHTQHFWRLLTDLKIPHATLLDIDFGRAGGGAGRYRDACTRLADVGIDVFNELDEFDSPDDLSDELALRELRPVRDVLREYGVFFSSPLDLDMLMLRHYWAAYTELDTGERGPQKSDATATVLGTGGTDRSRRYWDPQDEEESEERHDQLRWYRYLFTNRSKPATHLRALSRLDESALRKPPPVLEALIEFIRDRVESR